MDTIQHLITVGFLLSFCVCGAVSSGDRPTTRYVVNLDLPASQRWTEIFTNNKEYFRGNIEKAFSTIFSLIPFESLLKPLILKLAVKLEKELPKTMLGEIQGIAQSLNMSLDVFIIENLLYDITAFSHSFLSKKPQRGFCTSIIAKDGSNNIWHARNLDYGVKSPLTEVLKNLTLEVDFTKNGKVVYTGTTFAGLVGLYTAQKPNSFTVSIDERDQGSVFENLDLLFRQNVTLTSHLIRMVLDEAEDFDQAVNILAGTVTPAPVYLIVGGVKQDEGAVISKNRLKAQQVWYLGQNESTWFMVETNYDHWKPAPKIDDRRDTAIKAMNQLGQTNVGKDSLYKVLSVPLVCNPDTTYSTVMSAAQPTVYQTWIRENTCHV